MITLYRSTAVKSKNWRRPYSPQNPSEKLLLICCYLLLTRYRCPKNPFYLSVCGGRRVNVFRSSHGYHVTGLSTFESARTYTYREIQSRKKYCIYHIWVFISSCFNNHFINNFPFRLVQKFWEMVISCSYAYILLHIYILQAICYQQRSCLPALVIDFLLFIFDPIAFFRKNV